MIKKGDLMQNLPKTSDIFDTRYSIAEELLNQHQYPHEILPKIKGFIYDYFGMLDSSYKEVGKGVFIADDALIWSGTTIKGPTIIGHGAEIRPGAFIRGSVIVGNRAIIGNSTELKNSIIFDEAQLPHYNYVGDSIIGYKAHMGAGAIASNLRLDRKNIKLGKIQTNLYKIGVFLGDYSEVGCGSVICPGTIVGKRAVIYPLARVRGIIEEGEIYKSK
jgi:NDP-sugar pyrophosphorylase family protein